MMRRPWVTALLGVAAIAFGLISLILGAQPVRAVGAIVVGVIVLAIVATRNRGA